MALHLRLEHATITPKPKKWLDYHHPPLRGWGCFNHQPNTYTVRLIELRRLPEVLVLFRSVGGGGAGGAGQGQGAVRARESRSRAPACGASQLVARLVWWSEEAGCGLYPVRARESRQPAAQISWWWWSRKRLGPRPSGVASDGRSRRRLRTSILLPLPVVAQEHASRACRCTRGWEWEEEGERRACSSVLARARADSAPPA